jgi:DNA polymerase I-like protein with 3'-5' exonuclease and polymerase domains/uracil-DNA glycosylase
MPKVLLKRPIMDRGPVKPIRRPIRVPAALRPGVRDNSHLKENPLYFGSTNPDILFIVDPVVGNRDADEAPTISKPLNSRLLQYLTKFCEQHNVPIGKSAILSACPPVTAEQWDNAKKLSAHLKENREAFANVIKATRPRIIVPLGKSAASQLAGRSVQITKVRGVPTTTPEFGDVVTLPSLGIAHVIRIPENEPTFNADMDTLGKIVAAKYSLNYQTKIVQNYRWVTDLTFLFDKLKADGKLTLAADCEWTGGEWYDKSQKLLTVQLCYGPGEACAVPIDYNHQEKGWNPLRRADPIVRGRVASQLKRLLEDKRVRIFGQNFKGDAHVLRERLGIEVGDNYIDDTILLAHNVDENIKNKALSELTRLYVKELSGYSDEFDKDPIHEGKTRMDLVPPGKMLMYGCGDTDACWRARETLLTLAKKDLKNFACYQKVVMPAQRALIQNEIEGFQIDIDALRRFETKLRKHQEKEKKELLRMVPPIIRKLYYDNAKKPSLTRQVFLLQMLFYHRLGLQLEPRVFTKGSKNNRDESTRVPSTSSKDHLPYFKEHPFVAKLINYIKNDKLLVTYVGTERDDNGNPTGFYKYIRNGRIRPSYLLFRTVTGRSASINPNGQNFPKRGEFAKEYREIFVAPAGHVLIQVDYSQMELRIAAMMANDPVMIRLYKEGKDIHAATAAAVLGITLEAFERLPKDEKDLARFRAKAVNFGFLYGMGWRKFITYAKTEYGVDYTDEEAQRIRQAFFTMYRNLQRWHQAVRDFAKAHGYVRAYDGRVRHLQSVFSPDDAVAQGAERQAINSPVQAFGSDLGLMAMHLINANVSKKLVRVIGFIHDAIVCVAPEEKAVEAAAAIRHWMENIPLKKLFNFEPSVPIIAEAEVGKNLAKTIEISASWFNDPKVKTYAHLQYLDWQVRCKKAREQGKELPPMVGLKPGSNSRRKVILRRPTNAATKPATLHKPRKVRLVRRVS